MRTIQIGKRKIGENQPPFIIAEVGINHNGELDKAFEMIKVAKQAGADAVKFQTFKAEEFIGDCSLTYTYQSQGQEVTESMLKMFKRYEFSSDDWIKIKRQCETEEIMFLSTPQNLSDLEMLLQLDIPAIKVGSDDFTNLPLLKKYAETRFPLILSCGMSNLAEVYQALEAVGALDGYPLVLLLCTSQYPTPPQDVNLRKLLTLAGAFPMITLGFSDHTQGCLASSIAVGMGASVFEKHFTLDHDLPGPDHWFSEDPQGLKVWVDSINKAYSMLGKGILRPTQTELINKREFQRVIVAAKQINEGDIFTKDNLMMCRVSSAEGMPPSLLQFLLGKQAIRNFNKNEVITL